ncbi:MAG: ORF6N domain-containing protein [Acidobacteria bacterium]|nr:ORF6N domain-containing protein [Acidobacteriota bacterium]
MAKKEIAKTVVKISEIEDRIFIVRGQRVMLDHELADIYQVETKVLNQAVKRNLQRFPADFMFQLSESEFETIRSQNVTASKRNLRFRPYVFTEHGAVMLATILNSPTAIKASIVVVRAFVRMRAMLALHQDLADRVEELEKVTDYHGQKFGVVSDLLSQILRDPKFLKRKIGFVEAKKGKK